MIQTEYAHVYIGMEPILAHMHKPGAQEGYSLRQAILSMDSNNSSEGMIDRWASEMHAIKTKRDRVAFARLFDHFAPRIKSFLMDAMTSPETAEEIVQEAFITVWRKADQYDPQKATVAAWLFTICRNKKIDRLRSDRRPLPDMNDPAMAQEAPPLPDEIISSNQVVGSVRHALQDLPEDQRETINMAFVYGYAHGEIASRLGIPVGTVKSRIRLGVSKLRTALKNKELE